MKKFDNTQKETHGQLRYASPNDRNIYSKITAISRVVGMAKSSRLQDRKLCQTHRPLQNTFTNKGGMHAGRDPEHARQTGSRIPDSPPNS